MPNASWYFTKFRFADCGWSSKISDTAKTNRVGLSREDRQRLKDLTTSGTMKVRALKRAQILLKADRAPSGPAWSGSAIALALTVVPGTLANIHRRYVERG